MDFSQDNLPTVGRPKGAAWRRLESEGIEWEGQVLLTGDEVDLAALLIVSPLRVAICRGGAIVLDFDRDWLYPDPRLRPDGLVEFAITPPHSLQADALLLKIRGGRRVAAELISALTVALPPVAALPLFDDETPFDLPEPVSPQRQTRWARRRHPQLAQIAPVQPVDLLTLLTALDATDFPPVTQGKHPATVVWKGDPASSSLMTSETAATWQPQAPGWSPKPISGLKPRTSRHSRAGWIFRLSGLVLLLAAAAALGSGWSPRDTFVYDEVATEPVVVAIVVSPTSMIPSATETPSQPSLADAQTTAEQTAIALGVGGSNLPGTPSATAPAIPTEESPVVLPVRTATAAPVQSVATDPPPTETITPEPAETATVAPAATEAAATSTTSPATEIPSTTPTRQVVFAPPSPTTVESPTASPTIAASLTPTSTVTATHSAATSLDDQSASVNRGETPAQVFSDGALRYTINNAQRAVSLQELTLPPVAGAEWVVLLVEAVNNTNAPVDLPLNNLYLAPVIEPGNLVSLDETSRAIAEYLSYNPVYGAGDTLTLAAGESAKLALVWLVTPETGDLLFIAGNTAIALAPALAQPPAGDGLTTTAPKLVQATVLQVIDGQTIEVEINGEIARVQYLGVTAPLGDACFASESTAANTALVAGKTVWLERQRDHQTPDGAYPRDAWITGDSGEQLLVAVELSAQGAVLPDAAGADVRYAGWIAAAATSAQANNAGLWSACGSA